VSIPVWQVTETVTVLKSAYILVRRNVSRSDYLGQTQTLVLLIKSAVLVLETDHILTVVA
jgi:hypothetical protein